MMKALYERLARRCATVNQFNRLHINLENWMTPRQFVSLRQGLQGEPADGPLAAGRAWIDKQHFLFTHCKRPEPQPFERVRINRHIAIYRDPQGVPRRQRTLMVCFPGSFQRMMMPLHLFLQSVDARTVDVAVLRYPKGVGYRGGIEGFGKPGFEGMLAALGEALPTKEYGRVVTLGTSGGAAPALLMALFHQYDATMAAGIEPLDDPRWPESVAGGIPGLVGRCMKKPGPKPKVFLAYGADEPKDVSAAAAWATLTSCRKLGLSDPGRRVGHVVLWALLVNGVLAKTLADTVLKAEPRK